jgi:hypothetical protein
MGHAMYHFFFVARVHVVLLTAREMLIGHRSEAR